jgi:hypothetical protein
LSFNLCLACGAKSFLNALGQERQIIVIDWSVLACLTDAVNDLLATKWFGCATSFDD